MVRNGFDPYMELAALQQVLEVQGILVSVRCYLVTRPSMHYELVMRARGECCVVDVANDREAELPSMVQSMAALFASSLRTREGLFN